MDRWGARMSIRLFCPSSPTDSRRSRSSGRSTTSCQSFACRPISITWSWRLCLRFRSDNHPLGLGPRAAVLDPARPAKLLQEVVDLPELLLLRESVGELGQKSLIDILAPHRSMLAHQGQNQVEVILLVEAPLADVSARFAGGLRNRAGHDQVGIAALDQPGGLQAAVIVPVDLLPLLHPVEKHDLPEVEVGPLHQEPRVALVQDPAGETNGNLARILDERYTRLLMERTDLDLRQVMLLDRVQKGQQIDRDDHRRLKSAGLVGPLSQPDRGRRGCE